MIRFREAAVDDLGAIAALLADDGLGRGREAPGDPAYWAAFARMSAQTGNICLVAEEGGEIIACLQLTIIHGLSRRGMSRAQIEGVRVAAGRRGTGLGQALMREAIARAREAGCGLVQLTTDLRRGDAHRFYEGLGFTGTHLGMKLEL
ncbi:GNAT family N-acetyltransferase [Limibaculum sp. FT325]|uniref:GNAT family N-acetyltransferase n=1 Tax=Thermohalobaculum sediminis TaxID=2939436 RepID=UPI0020C18A5E|nr:GNAT family N-acetyltransferase [Limibaculum sediminis]MCL5776603.1 GNAT family N-acetyltransferase [Limibaculum sediminis]